MGGIFNPDTGKQRGGLPKWETPDGNRAISLGDDSLLFSDDTGVGYTTKEEIHPEITAYENVTLRNNVLVN